MGVLFEDVTLHKQTEESLRQGERRYRAIIEDQTELICRYLPDGTITFVNEAFCRYYEQSRETLIGQKIIPFISKISRKKFIEFVNSSDPDNPLNLVEEKVVLPTGEVRWQQRSDRAIFDDHGQLIEFQSVGIVVHSLTYNRSPHSRHFKSFHPCPGFFRLVVQKGFYQANMRIRESRCLVSLFPRNSDPNP